MLRQGRTGGLAAWASVIAVSAVVGTASAALAAAPSNDDRGAARVVNDVPFADAIDTTDATAQENDPDCFDVGGSPTVWYSFTPANDGVFVATTAGSDYDTTLTLARPGQGGLEIIHCDDDGAEDATSRLGWHANAGVEYLLMVGSFSGGGGRLEFAIRRLPPPPSPEIRISRSASLTKGGAALIRGSVRCDGRRDRVDVYVLGRQDMGRRIISGRAWLRMRCGGPWTVRVRNGAFRFAPGSLFVQVAVEWCTEFDCGVERARRLVRIR